jgi:hypothetical protein
MDMVIAVPDRYPPDAIIFLPVRGQAGAVHHVAGDLRPLIIREHLVAGRGPHRAVPHRALEPPPQRVVGLVQQPGQPPEIPLPILP